MNIILLSGGSGKRLWPLSNGVRSKQFLKILKSPDGMHESMVQRMYRMIKTVDSTASVTISTSENQAASIRSQLGEGGQYSISIEPCRRDTFPAIVLAVAYLHDKVGIGEDEPVVICPVDPYVDESYFEMLGRMSRAAEDGKSNLVLMGIEPTYPSAKYGYIIPKISGDASPVQSFKEKPTEAEAKELIASKALWNGGVFACKLSYVLSKARQLLGISSYDDLLAAYGILNKISFDYAVVEAEPSISVLRYTGSWKDLGTWNTLTEAMNDEVAGKAEAVNCTNVHIINELQVPLIALGLQNLVIAATPDGILVSDKHMSSYLKNYVADARPMTERRVWGEYEVLDYRTGESGIFCSLIKHLRISSGKHISYQKHHHRSEVWTVIEGEGAVILDGKVISVRRGSTVVVPLGAPHAVKAETDLHIIEVQIGDDLTEEDIERIGWNWRE